MPGDEATKKDLQDLEARLDGKLDVMEIRIGEVVHEAVRDSETRILKAIFGYTETTTARQNGADAKLTEMQERLKILERRLFEVEKRLSLPPAA